MATKPGPTVRRAVLWMLDGIEARRWQPGARLPGVRAMASRADVGVWTMVRAVALLRDRRILEGRQGQRTTVRDVSPSTITGARAEFLEQGTPPRRRLARWEEVARSLERDIYSGVFTRGHQIPWSKQLTDRYGTSYRTLRAALQHLCELELLERHGRGYRVRPLHASAPGAAITLVAPMASFRGEGFWGPITGYPRQFEIAVRNCGLRPTRIGFSYDEAVTGFTDPDTTHPAAERDWAHDSVLGYLFVLTLYAPAAIAALHRVASTGKPVAVLDLQGRYHHGRYRFSPNVRVLSLADSFTGGLAVGRYLVDRGHKRAAFVSHDTPSWVAQRLEGVRKAYREAGAPRGVVAVLGDRSGSQIRHESGFDRDFAALYEYYKRWRGDRYNLLINQLDYQFEVQYPQATINMIALRDFFNRLCATVAGHDDITALIAPSDRQAGWALVYLREHGIAVPGRMAVIGFDDSSAAVNAGITSYSFNAESTISNSIEYILRPSTFRGLQRKIEVEGSIVERASTL